VAARARRPADVAFASLAAPVLLHLASNCAGALASALASRMQEDAGLAGAGDVEVVAGPGAGDE
jgi:hypothetical protein